MVDDGAESVVELARAVAQVGDPEHSLGAIVELRARLDELEEFQVEEALRRGLSWARIGRALRRSKQAAHKRYAGLAAGAARGRRVVVTAEARRVVALARDEAARLGSRAVAPEHLALALVLLHEGPPGLGARDARAAARRAARVRATDSGLTVPARRVLEQSLRECVARGDNELRPEHIRLALRAGRNVRTPA